MVNYSNFLSQYRPFHCSGGLHAEGENSRCDGLMEERHGEGWILHATPPTARWARSQSMMCTGLIKAYDSNSDGFKTQCFHFLAGEHWASYFNNMKYIWWLRVTLSLNINLINSISLPSNSPIKHCLRRTIISLPLILWGSRWLLWPQLATLSLVGCSTMASHTGVSSAGLCHGHSGVLMSHWPTWDTSSNKMEKQHPFFTGRASGSFWPFLPCVPFPTKLFWILLTMKCISHNNHIHVMIGQVI